MGQGIQAGLTRAALAERLTAQLLAGPPARDPLAVTERLLAIQAQDLRGARLAIRARTAGLTVADVDRALTDDRSLVLTWLNRGTLHLVRSEDHAWLHALTAPPRVTGNAARLRQEGVSPASADRGVRTIEHALAADGPLTRAQLRDRLDAADVPTAGQALVHVLMLATLRGLTVRGPMVGREQAYVLVHDWLGPRRPVDREVALAELARRFLTGHGPATDGDLARWAGLGLRDARAGLAAIAPQLRERGDGLVDLAGHPRAEPLRAGQLLGAFEPVLMGWTSREPVLGAHGSLVTTNGIFKPFVAVRGRAVGTWRLDRTTPVLEIRDPVSARAERALRADAADVTRFLSG